MNLKECYSSFGGDYDEVKLRLQSDNLIQRMVIKFLNDKSFEDLKVNLDSKNYKEAFRAAHTLKGVSLNLSFKNLCISSGELTELLRNHEAEEIDEKKCGELFQKVSDDYIQLTEAIGKLDK